METIILFLFAIVGSIGMFIGLDLKQWTSWIFGLFGFICGFLLGFLNGGVIPGFQLGAIFAFVVMSVGAMNRVHRQRYKGALDAWLLRYGQGKHPILLARTVKKLMGRD